jgi:hypothetical protein
MQPVDGLHESGAVQRLLSLQTNCAPGTQTPPKQVSFRVQALLSEHGMVLLVNTQAPVVVLHVSVVQTLLSLQPPGHGLHSGIAVCIQLPVAMSQESMVQELLSSQFLSVNPQMPVDGLQLSSVHSLLSLQ